MEVNSIQRIVTNKLVLSVNNSISESIFLLAKEGSLLNATVLQKVNGSSEYLLNIKGKQLRLQSEAKLLPGERLELGIRRIGANIELEVVRRSNGAKEIENSELQKGWSKNYYSVSKTIEQVIEPVKSEIASQKILQFLDVYFPGIQWKEETEHFNWEFEDAKAEGYFGKSKDRYSFYFHYQSSFLGEIDSYIYSNEEDFSNLTLHCIFYNLAIYFRANENLNELKKMLSSNSISANDIIFHYSSFDNKKKGEWVV